MAQQGYSSIDPAAAEFSHQFEAQAEKLFAAERTVDTLPSITALPLLYTSIAVHGDVPRAMQYLIAANDAAEKMKLFGNPETAKSGSPKATTATSQAAWGLFNFLVYANAKTPPP